MTNVVTLTEDMITPYDPRTREGELRYFADGTDVVMRWTGGERRGTAIGMVPGGIYAWQLVEWSDGTRDHVAPQALHRAAS